MGKMIRYGGRGLFLVVLWLTGFNVLGRAVPDAADPVGFFTTVADKLLRSTFSFGVTNIPVCSNGVYVYSPAVQRLLQLSANVYDAANTNYFPVVFRPCFSGYTNGNLFITGYTNVASVTGPVDPQLAEPLAPTAALPAGGTNVFINVYGVPWIIGAKKGLPGFNQFAMMNAAQFTRKLQLSRDKLDPFAATYITNQMYTMSISNRVGLSYWNAYNADYPRPVVIYARDTLYMALSNSTAGLGIAHFNINGAIVNSWPGSQWDGVLPNATPQDAAFVRANWTTNYLNEPTICTFGPTGPLSFTSSSWTSSGLSAFPPVTLLVTNYLQTYILDGEHVIDYVQLCGPISNTKLNEVLADPDFPDPQSTDTFWLWSTNTVYTDLAAPTFGVLNQLQVSANPSLAPRGEGKWIRPPTMPPPLGYTPEAESAFYCGFFMPSFNIPGDPNTYVNQEYTIQAPYTPTRTVFSAYLLQANDPLVHYLASDLNGQIGTTAVWSDLATWRNGVWTKVGDTVTQPLPIPPATPIGGRYQPWGCRVLWAAIGGIVDTNAYNLTYKDPLVWGPDNWSFPTNLLSDLSGLGQVHRGTPWQTLYLKAHNILKGNTMGVGTGTNTWVTWTGDLQRTDGLYRDAAIMAPVSDRRLTDLLIALLDTNDIAQRFPVNNPNPADWLSVFDGVTVYSNSAAKPLPGNPPVFDTYTMSSNAMTTVLLANDIAAAKATQPDHSFYSVGDILATTSLSESSPWLSTNAVSRVYSQINYGIADAAYEAIPAQLLLRLRPDAVGSLLATNGGWALQFSGSDAYTYEVQSSADLVHWQPVSTNQPVQGRWRQELPAPDAATRFYRSVLVP